MDGFIYFFPIASGLLFCAGGIGIGFFYHEKLAQSSSVRVKNS